MTRPAASTHTAIVADDLTGALDCAVAFIGDTPEAKPFVMLEPGVTLPPGCGAVSVNADSRRLSPAEARPVFRRAVESIQGESELTYVKIDSTLRGHPGVEITECAAAVGASLVIVCPAFPATGRTVRDGHLLVHSVRLEETEVGRDPLSPVGASRVSSIVSADNFEEMGLSDVRKASLTEQLRLVADDSNSECRVVFCDAETDEDLHRIAVAGIELKRSGILPGPVIFAGSAGLAFALAQATRRDGSGLRVAKERQLEAPALIITASQRTLADRQLAMLSDRNLATVHSAVFSVDSAHNIAGPQINDSAVTEALKSGRSVAVRASIGLSLESLPAEAVRSIADRVTARLGQWVSKLVADATLGTLVLIGGDTAHAALTAIGARGIVLDAEPLPGVPVGVINGGQLDGVTIATKAGAFGDDATLLKLLGHRA